MTMLELDKTVSTSTESNKPDPSGYVDSTGLIFGGEGLIDCGSVDVDLSDCAFYANYIRWQIAVRAPE